MLAPALRPNNDGGPTEGQPSEDKIVDAWKKLQALDGGANNDNLDSTRLIGGGAANGVSAAGVLDFLDPRHALRLASLYLMKDRAGKVGSKGVADLLRDMLSRSSAPIHVVGHSFGAKVVLSALAAGAPPPRKIKSALLLQPAISHLSFAEIVPGRTGSGGYRPVLARVQDPILSTFSAHDFPLHQIYHLALLRSGDLGEAQIAATAGAGDPPSAYAALGGYGPRGSGERLIPLPAPGEIIDPAGKALVGLDGTAGQRIDSHGGVANKYTAWALRTQMGH